MAGYGKQEYEVAVVLTDMPVVLDLAVLRRRLQVRRESQWAEVCRLAEQAHPLIVPRAVYRPCLVARVSEDTVQVDGVPLQSRVLRRNLDEARQVFPFVVTIGPQLEEYGRSCGDVARQYYLDVIGNVALTSVRTHFEDHLRSRFGLECISHMSPGSLEDWPLEQQTELFSLLGDVEAAIGVHLTENQLMIPGKSISGITFPSATRFVSCRLCPREDCSARAAAFDGELAASYGIHED